MRFLKLILTLGILSAGATGCFTKSLTMVPMRHEGMTPALQRGAAVQGDLGAFGHSRPRRWDIVVYEPIPDALSRDVLRVVGLPGETVSIDAQGGLLIDGAVPKRPESLGGLTYPALAPDASAVSSWEVPSGEYFLLADHPEATRDSRHFGAIPRSQILGLVSRP